MNRDLLNVMLTRDRLVLGVRNYVSSQVKGWKQVADLAKELRELDTNLGQRFKTAGDYGLLMLECSRGQGEHYGFDDSIAMSEYKAAVHLQRRVLVSPFKLIEKNLSSLNEIESLGFDVLRNHLACQDVVYNLASRDNFRELNSELIVNDLSQRLDLAKQNQKNQADEKEKEFYERAGHEDIE
jgi:hypothetical protein